MNRSFLDCIGAGEILVADGAMGTQLMERGLVAGACPEEWNLSRPQDLEEIARLYLAAGAQVIQTNTFGGSPLKLAKYDLDSRCEEINRAAVAAVRAIVGQDAFVSGSCGPTGCTLKPYGDTEPAAVADGFARQCGALIEAGVDVICVETMTDLVEATLAVKAAKAISRDLPVMATMTFDRTPRGFFTIMGVDIPSAVAGLAAAGADLVGSNCGNGSENMVLIARELRARTDLPLVIQANAGLPELQGDRVVYGESPEFMAEKARELVACGVSVVGGCCGTTPAHIAALRQALLPVP